MSDTPRTDAVFDGFGPMYMPMGSELSVMLLHARELERELNETILRAAKVAASNGQLRYDLDHRNDASMADKRDAERYRWLCLMAWGVPMANGRHTLEFRNFDVERWPSAMNGKTSAETTKQVADAAIDAAMDGSKSGIFRADEKDRQ